MTPAVFRRLLKASTFAVVAAMALPETVDVASFSYTGPVVPIPDGADLTGTNPGAQVGAAIAVSGISQPVGSVTMSIDGTACTADAGATTVGIDHSFVNDLVITLRSPTGTEVTVIDHTDGSGNNFCQVVLDDASAGPSIQTAVSGNAPFTGSWKPNAPLSALAGETANGDWTLLAQDYYALDTGNIRAWTINIVPQAPLPPPPPPRAVPTLSAWGMIGLASLLALGTLFTLRRKRQ